MKTGLKLAGAGALALGLASLAVAGNSSGSGTPPMPAAKPAAIGTTAPSQAAMAGGAAAKPATLTKGQIMDIQKALDAKGYHVKADGFWGKWSTKDLMNYQKKNGLPTTGYPDAKTRQSLGLSW